MAWLNNVSSTEAMQLAEAEQQYDYTNSFNKYMDIDGDKKLDIIKNTLNGKTLFKFNSFSSDSQSLWEA